MWLILNVFRYLNVKTTLFRVSAAIVCLFTISSTFAQEDYGTWPGSARIYINTSDTGATISKELLNFPLLVRLNPLSFKDFANTQPGGADIRFAKPDGTPLSYEIERWIDDPNNADTAEIWVSIDTVFGKSGHQFFRMYWGKSDVTSKSNPQTVFGTANGFNGVWHLGEAGAAGPGNYKDATGLSNGTGKDMTSSSTTQGPIGGCQRFNGVSQYIELGKIGIHDFNAYTLSMWVKGTPQKDKRIFCETNVTNHNSMFALGTNFDGTYEEMECFIRDTDGAVRLDHEYTDSPVFNDAWHHVVWVDNGGSYSIFVDGVRDWTGNYIKNKKSFTTTAIGAVVREPYSGYYFAGAIDELALSRTNRSGDWIKLSYETQKPGASCVYLAAAEPAPPSVSKHPSDVSVHVGATATMTVTASGASPLTYAWFKTTVASGNAMANQTANTLSLTNVQAADTGSYLCVVRNDYGADTSDPARLTVIGDTPRITVQPGDVTVTENQPWSMSVSATGTPAISYSWYKTGNPVAIGSADSYAVQTAQLSDAGTYYCVAANQFGACTSRTATVTVTTQGDPNVITNPIVVRGVSMDSITVRLTLSGYASLPTQASAGSAWHADTVMIWFRSGSFPSGTPNPSTAALKIFFPDMKAAPGDSFSAAMTVPAIGPDYYYFKASVHWRNPSHTPPDSIPPFTGDENGANVYMGSTAGPVTCVPVTCFKENETTVSAFDGAVVLKKIEKISINATVHTITPPPLFSGGIPVSGMYRFEPAAPQPATLRFGLRYDSIPQGYTAADIRMYHHDSTNNTTGKHWFVDTIPERDSVTKIISIRIPASKNTFPFLLAIDTVRPSIEARQNDTSAIQSETEIPIQVGITDNIANPEIKLLAGRADDTLASIPPSAQQYSWIIPWYYVKGSCGMRILLIVHDGRFTDTVNLSRDIRVSDADTVSPLYEKWMPLGASVALDNADVQTALDEYTQGSTWAYDDTKLRLFRWIDGKWLEYSAHGHDRFSFTPGRQIWLKTRRTGPVSLGNGRTVSLRHPYSITLKAKNWTDFTLPYRFDIYIGDVLSETGPDASNSLQFYVWNRNQAGRYCLKEFYLPSNYPYDDGKNRLSHRKDNEKTAYSVFNPLDRDVELRIPGTPVALSNVRARREKHVPSGWSIAVRSRTGESEDLSPVFCTYRPDLGGAASYPLPPSWSKASVGIAGPDRKNIFGNVLLAGEKSGGYVCQLVFENRAATATDIFYSVERLAGNDIMAGVLDPLSGTVSGTDTALRVTVGPRGRKYRWLAVGSPRYVENLSAELTKTEFALSLMAPNPFRGLLRIGCKIPCTGIASVRCELIDKLGRVVWSATEARNVRPGGTNEFVWNPRNKTLAAGNYIVRLSGFDGGGKKRGERLSRVVYLP